MLCAGAVQRGGVEYQLEDSFTWNVQLVPRLLSHKESYIRT